MLYVPIDITSINVNANSDVTLYIQSDVCIAVGLFDTQINQINRVYQTKITLFHFLLYTRNKKTWL